MTTLVAVSKEEKADSGPTKAALYEKVTVPAWTRLAKAVRVSRLSLPRMSCEEQQEVTISGLR